MTPERWAVVKQALVEALTRAPQERAAYLEAITVTDPELRQEVEGLLAHHADEDFVEQRAMPVVAVPGSALRPGATFGPYEIQSQLGEGGMGLVFLAQDRALDRPVALKFLSARLQQPDEARRRFLREAKAAAALDHPYICKIYQTGEEDGRPFIAMEYVRGETLRSRLDASPMPLKDILRLGIEVAEALESAHAARIVHRDLKPSNIMLTTGGHVKVLDFGLAKRIGEEVGVYAETRAELTETGTVHGTVAYMSPEQVRGQEVDVRSDIFSLGVVLYESLTGKNPFKAGSLLETASQVLHHMPPTLGLTRNDVPALLEHVVHTMLAKAPEHRYQSAHDLGTELARVRDLIDRGDGDVEGTARLVPTRWWLTVRRRTIAALAAMAVTIAGAGVWWSRRAPGGAAANKGPLSVAVMPFANVSGDPQNAYLANGITQAVTTRLHRAGLRVIPWETARRFRDASNPMEVARTLSVDSVLSGSFQTNHDRLLVTVSLVEGATGFLMWTDELEDSFDGIFQVLARIAQGVATNLGHELTGDAVARLAKIDRESTDLGYDFFTRAVEIDPNLTQAHVGLGAVYLERFWNGWGGGVGNLGLAEKSFKTVLQRDAADMRARRGLTLIEFYRGRGESGLQFARDAARLDANDVETLLARAAAYANGLEELQAQLLERVLALDPGNEYAAWGLPVAFFNTDRFEEAVKGADEYGRRFGHEPFVSALAANALERRGNLGGARDHYDRVTEPLMESSAKPGSPTSHDLTALFYAGAFHSRHGQRDRAQALWQAGLRLTGNALANDPESIGLRLFQASFLGVLGHRVAFEREEAAALALAKAADVNPWELIHLASAHASFGNSGRALEILRNALRSGRLYSPAWLTMAAPTLQSSEQLLREFDVEEQRLRRQYAPAS